jgi:hypothetical protein
MISTIIFSGGEVTVDFDRLPAIGEEVVVRGEHGEGDRNLIVTRIRHVFARRNGHQHIEILADVGGSDGWKR